LDEFSPIGRLLTLGSFVKISEIAQIILLLVSTVKVAYYFSQEMDWAIFWATFSQSQLVTLPVHR
jgi:hypothetical protein